MREGFSSGFTRESARPRLFRDGYTDVYILRTNEKLSDLVSASFSLDDDHDKLRLLSCTITSLSDHSAWHFEAPPHVHTGNATLTEVNSSWSAEMPMRPLYRISVSTGSA